MLLYGIISAILQTVRQKRTQAVTGCQHATCSLCFMTIKSNYSKVIESLAKPDEATARLMYSFLLEKTTLCHHVSQLLQWICLPTMDFTRMYTERVRTQQYLLCNKPCNNTAIFRCTNNNTVVNDGIRYPIDFMEYSSHTCANRPFSLHCMACERGLNP